MKAALLVIVVSHFLGVENPVTNARSVDLNSWPSSYSFACRWTGNPTLVVWNRWQDFTSSDVSHGDYNMMIVLRDFWVSVSFETVLYFRLHLKWMKNKILSSLEVIYNGLCSELTQIRQYQVHIKRAYIHRYAMFRISINLITLNASYSLSWSMFIKEVKGKFPEI